MEHIDKREMARRLRAEAEAIRRHGMGNFFEHTFACLRFGRLGKEGEEDLCRICPIREFVRADYRDKAYPCQHVNEQGWNLASEHASLAAQYAEWLLRSATQLEDEATRENP
jgi:hypothetical protein